MKFSSPDQSIATCKSKNCEDCMVNGHLHCHASQRDLPRFLLLICPTLLLGGAGVGQMNAGMLIPWLVLLVGCFGFGALRGTGSHCLTGAKIKRALTSLPGLGALNIFNDRFAPMSNRQRVLFFTGVGLAWGYPAGTLIYGHQFFLLAAYLISTASFLATLRSFLCSRCIDFGCPMNSVDDYVRSDFYECNPGVAMLWKRKNPRHHPFWRHMNFIGMKKRTI